MSANAVSAQPSSLNNDRVNPYAYAMEHLSQSMRRHTPSRQHSRATSRNPTPAPSKPASIHEHSADESVNPYAYAMEHLSQALWKHAPSHAGSRAASRALSRSPSIQELIDNKPKTVENKTAEAKEDVNPYAYAIRNSWVYKHSPL